MTEHRPLEDLYYAQAWAEDASLLERRLTGALGVLRESIELVRRASKDDHGQRVERLRSSVLHIAQLSDQLRDSWNPGGDKTVPGSEDR